MGQSIWRQRVHLTKKLMMERNAKIKKSYRPRASTDSKGNKQAKKPQGSEWKHMTIASKQASCICTWRERDIMSYSQASKVDTYSQTGHSRLEHIDQSSESCLSHLNSSWIILSSLSIVITNYLQIDSDRSWLTLEVPGRPGVLRVFQG